VCEENKRSREKNARLNGKKGRWQLAHVRKRERPDPEMILDDKVPALLSCKRSTYGLKFALLQRKRNHRFFTEEGEKKGLLGGERTNWSQSSRPDGRKWSYYPKKVREKKGNY